MVSYLVDLARMPWWKGGKAFRIVLESNEIPPVLVVLSGLLLKKGETPAHDETMTAVSMSFPKPHPFRVFSDTAPSNH
jgi:hypothetical protein